MNANKPHKKTTSIRLDKSLYTKIELLAKAQNRSVNNLIETILLRFTDDTEMSKEEYKQKLLESKESGVVSLSIEEHKRLFDI